MVMHDFQNQTVVRNEGIYNFGPWTTYTVGEHDRTWANIVYDWTNTFNAIILEHVREKTTVIQAGGWQGVYPFLLSNIFESVITFEPDPINFHCLTLNCQRPNIYKFQAALGQTSGYTIMNIAPDSGMNFLEHKGALRWDKKFTLSKKQVMTLSIDDIGVSECGLIMLDVENYELFVLKGAIQTIEKFRPAVILEKGYDANNYSKIHSLMTALGYANIIDLGKDVIYVD